MTVNRSDPSTTDVHTALSGRDPNAGRHELSRRYFLQAAAAAGGAAMLPMAFADMAEAATPLGAAEGVLVILWMEGGNDGLNTVIPVNNGRYHDLRSSVAISARDALPITDSRSLHPELGYLQTLYQRGDVAVLDGVGDPENDLSHFESTARFMSGGTRYPTSGWVGRYIDGLPGGVDPFHAVSLGRSVPLLMQGENRRATGLPTSPNGLINPKTASDVELRQVAAIDAMGAGSTGLGALGDSIALAGRTSIAIAGRLAPTYTGDVPEERLSAQMVLAARLINANLGIRVINVSYGDFDGHAGHPQMHRDRMREFNAALRSFHQTLSPAFTDRTMVLTLSEFGRRAHSNNSAGTDHGSASTLLAIGTGAVGGFHGEFASLDRLDRRQNQVATVDYRSVFATTLDRWLGADADAILGGRYEPLSFLGTPGDPGSGGQSPPVEVVDHRAQVIRLYLAYFLRLPDREGLEYWLGARRRGVTLGSISQTFAESSEFAARYGALADDDFVDLVYRNVLTRDPDAGGRRYWSDQLKGGTRRGDLMVGFSESTEFESTTASRIYDFDAGGPIGRLYRAYFLRAPDAEGLGYWSESGMGLASISVAFADSSEFKERYGTLSHQAFVELVYENVMGRTPDAAGLAFWVEKLYGGMTRGALMLNFSESPEFQELVSR